MNEKVNWAKAYNLLFEAFDREGTPLYVGGGDFCQMVQQINPSSPKYPILINQRKGQGKSNSRNVFYSDLIESLEERERYELYQIFIARIEPHDKARADAIRVIVFGDGRAVPTRVVPSDLSNSDKLNNSLRNIDEAIAAANYSRANTLSYTCLEGLYKTYVDKHLPEHIGQTDITQLCKVVKNDIAKKLQAQGPFPEQIINVMPTLTNAIANSRNGFSESHFGQDSKRWLAVFSRDLTNSIGGLILHFM